MAGLLELELQIDQACDPQGLAAESLGYLGLGFRLFLFFCRLFSSSSGHLLSGF